MALHRENWLPTLDTGWVAAAIAAATIATQPGSSTVRLGQIGFVLLWLVCEDLLGRDSRRSAGVLVGLATAVKLTPAVFILLQIVVGRIRAAAVAMSVIVAAVGIGWIVAPSESATYWRHLGPDVSTVGPVTAPDHWSINGAIWRIAGNGGNDLAWFVLAAITMVASLALARRWWRGGSSLGAIGIVGLGSVLASPFSWSHHWLLVAPLFVALLGQVRAHRYANAALAAVAAAYVLTITSVWWHAPRFLLGVAMGDQHAERIALNSYLVVAALLLSLAWLLRPPCGRPSAAHRESTEDHRPAPAAEIEPSVIST